MSELIGATSFQHTTLPTGTVAVHKIERSALTHGLTPDHIDVIQTLFRQLTHALTILSSAAELTLNQTGHHSGDSATQHIRIWLQPSARHAEDVLRRLRNLNLPHSALLTDLTQSLTVLVLAADMIAQGQLSGAVMPELYSLMRRNAERSMNCLSELQSTLGE